MLAKWENALHYTFSVNTTIKEISEAEGAAISKEIKAVRRIQGLLYKISSLPYTTSIGIMPPKKKDIPSKFQAQEV